MTSLSIKDGVANCRQLITDLLQIYLPIPISLCYVYGHPDFVNHTKLIHSSDQTVTQFQLK